MNEIRFPGKRVCSHPVEKYVGNGVIFVPCGKEMVGKGLERIMFCVDGHRAGMR